MSFAFMSCQDAMGESGSGNDVLLFGITEDELNSLNVSGTPDEYVNVGEVYTFTPTVNKPASETLTFTIDNALPPWLTFDQDTGVITGTAPGSGGPYGPYIITATTETGNTYTIGPFNINLNNPPVVNISSNTETTAEDNADTDITFAPTDGDGDSLTYTIGTNGTNGSCTISGTTVTYTPNANYSGTDTCTVVVSDGKGGTASETITYTVTPTNDAPVVTSASGTATEDTQVIITLPYTDGDGDSATSCAVTGISGGTITQACACSAGVCTVGITPASNSNGNVTANYTVNDGTTNSNSGSVTVGVTPVNDAPVSTPASTSTNEDTEKIITLPYTDVDAGDQATSCAVTGLSSGSITTACACSAGVCSVGITPDLNDSTTITGNFTVNDGDTNSNSSGITLTVTPINDPPVSTNTSTSTNEDTQKIITLPYTDADVGDQATSCAVTGVSGGTITQACACSAGTCTVGLTPSSNSTSNVTANFTVNDGDDDSNSSSITLSVTPQNDAPVATPASGSTPEDTQKILTLPYTDPDAGDQAVSCSVTGVTNGTITQACACSAGTCTVGLTPTTSSTATITGNFTVNDGDTDSNSSTVSVTVTGTNNAPVASPVADTTNEDTEKTVTLSYTDADIGDQAETCSVTGVSNGSITTACACSAGTCTVGLTPSSNSTTTVTANYTVNDGDTNSNSSTISVTVTPVNDPPAATPASDTTNEDTEKIVTLPYTEPDAGDQATSCAVTGVANGTITAACACSAGTCTVGLTPSSNSTTTVTGNFTVNDGDTDSNSSTISLTVTPQNDAPVATPASTSTTEDTEKSITLPYTDPDAGDQATTCSVTGVTNGTVTTACACSAGVCTVGITPASNSSTTVTGNFTVNDGDTDSNSSTISMTVTPANDPPVASPVASSTNEDTEKVVTLSYTDVDVGDQAETCAVTGVANGTITAACACSAGTCTVGLTPSSNSTTAVTANYTVNDGDDDSNSSTISISVTPQNDAPVATPATDSTAEDTEKSVTLPYTDPDAGDQATSCAVTGVTNGTITAACACSAGTCTVGLTPTASSTATITGNFTVNDGDTDSNSSTISVTVTPTNDAPVASPVADSTNEDTEKVVTLSYTDADVGDQAETCALTGVTNGSITTACACSGGTCTVGLTPSSNSTTAVTANYTVNDGDADSNSSTISITVTPQNDAPAATPATDSTNEDTEKSITLPYTDPDAGDQATSCAVTGVTNGTITAACACSAGTCTVGITPSSNSTTTVTGNFTVNDGDTDSNSSTISLTVTPVNDAPVASPVADTTNEDTEKTVTLSYTDPDAGDQATSCALTGVTNATITSACACSAGTCTVGLTPTANSTATITANYTVNDGDTDSNSSTISVTVTPQPDLSSVTTMDSDSDGQIDHYKVCYDMPVDR